MGFSLRLGLIFLVALLPAFANAAGKTIQVKDEDAFLLQEIDDGLSALMGAAGECRSTDANLYECLCTESKSLKKLPPESFVDAFSSNIDSKEDGGRRPPASFGSGRRPRRNYI